MTVAKCLPWSLSLPHIHAAQIWNILHTISLAIQPLETTHINPFKILFFLYQEWPDGHLDILDQGFSNFLMPRMPKHLHGTLIHVSMYADSFILCEKYKA